MIITKLFLFTLLAKTIVTQNETEVKIDNLVTSTTSTKLYCFYSDDYNFKFNSAILNETRNLCDYYIYVGTTVDPNRGIIAKDGFNVKGLASLSKLLGLKLLLLVTPPVYESHRDSILYGNARPFIDEIIQQLRGNYLEGIILQSEFSFIGADTDRVTFSENFVKEFRNAIEEEAYISKSRLVLGLYADNLNVFLHENIDISSLIENFDLVIVPHKNFYHPINGYINHLTPLYWSPNSPSLNTTQFDHSRYFHTTVDLVNYFLKQGVDPAKLIFELTTEGYTFTLTQHFNITLGAPSKGAGRREVFPRSSNDGSIPFFEACRKLKQEPGWFVFHTMKTEFGPYAWRGDQWFSFDDMYSIRVKTQYIMNKHFRGVLLKLNKDDFEGNCYERKFPLTKEARKTVGSYKVDLKKFPKLSPKLPSSVTCPKLDLEYVDITCYKNYNLVSCNGTFDNGFVVEAKCKKYFQENEPADYKRIKCENGKWSNDLIKCVPKCGIIYGKVESLISEGVEETFGNSPWHVAVYDIRDKEDMKLICGGTIITQRIIVSAAHCFYDETTRKRENASNYEIVVAKVSRNYHKIDNAIQHGYQIKELRFSEKEFQGSRLNYILDIVLIITKDKIGLSFAVVPACVDLEEKFYPEGEVSGKISGWGLNANDNPSEKLQTATLPYINYTACRNIVGETFQPFVTVDKFCAGYLKGPGVRKGDSGGGYLVPDSGNRTYYLRGIVSLRPKNYQFSIAMFTDISFHIEWILPIVEMEYSNGI